MTDIEVLLERAKQKRRSGNFDVAVQILDEILTRTPSDIPALKELANALSGMEDYAGTIEALDQVKALEPLGKHTTQLYQTANLRLLRLKALELRKAGSLKDAAEMLNSLLEQHPNDIGLLKDMALVQHQLNNDAGVVQTLEKVIAQEPLGEHTQALYNEAWARHMSQEAENARKQKRHQDAISILSDLLKSKPDDVTLLKKMATAAFDAAEFQLVHKVLDHAQKFEPLGAQSSILYARSALRLGDPEAASRVLLPIIETSKNVPLAAYYHLAEAEGRLGKLESALVYLEDLKATDPSNVKKWPMLGRAYYMLRDFQNSYSAFETGKSLQPLEQRDAISFGRAALHCEKFPEAIEIFKTVNQIDPSHLDALFLLHEAQRKSNDDVSAEQTAAKISALTPKTARALLKLGIFFRRNMNFDTAVKFLEKALTKTEDTYAIEQEIAECDLRRGLFTQARERLELLLQQDTQNARTHFLLARTLAKQGRNSKSRHHFERVIEIKPDQASAYRELAMIAILEAKQEEALALLQKSLDLEPNSGSTNSDIAALYLEKGQYKKAKQHAEASLEIEPNRDAAKVVLRNIDLFYSSEERSLTIVCAKDKIDEWSSKIPDAQIIASSTSLKDAARQATGDWVVFARSEKISADDMEDITPQLDISDGSLLTHSGEICVANRNFMKDMSDLHDHIQSVSESIDFHDFMKVRGREIYPPLSTTSPTPLAPLSFQGEVFLISSSGHNLFGGAEHFLRGLCIFYEKLGFTPVIVGHRGEENQSGTTADGIPFFEFREEDESEFRSFLVARLPELVHVVTGSGPKIIRTAQDLNIPVIYGTHFWREMFLGTGWFPDIDRISAPKREFMNLVRRNEVVYVNSKFTREMQYSAHELISPVFYSLPSDETRQATRDGRDIVLLVNARPEKGFDLLLEIAKQNPDLLFVTIASQSSKDEAAQSIVDSQLENIELLDHVSDMSALYKRAWCVLVPSHRFIETFSRVVIEAHRFGVPVIGSDRGNVPLLLTEAGVSLPEDASAWSSELRRLAEDTDYWTTRSRLASENSERYAFAPQFDTLKGLVTQAKRPVLVAIGNGIGNIIQCAPAIRMLSEHLGQPVDIVMNQDFPGCEWLMAGSEHVGMVFNASSSATRRRYELVIVLASFGKSVPRFHARRTFIARHKIPFEATNTLHEAKYNLDCLVAADIGFTYDEADVQKYFVGDLEPTGLTSNRIVLHAGGKAGEWAVKRWPYFEALAAQLMARGWEVISVGAPDEYVPGTIDRTGTPLQESISTIQGASYVVANDSGLMHVADGIGIPLTSIFGPTSVVKNGPLSINSHVIELKKDCAPCQFNQRFKTCKCIEEISLETVLKQVLAHLADVHPAPETARSVDQ